MEVLLTNKTPLFYHKVWDCLIAKALPTIIDHDSDRPAGECLPIGESWIPEGSKSDRLTSHRLAADPQRLYY